MSRRMKRPVFRIVGRVQVRVIRDETRRLGDPAGTSVNSSGLESWNYNDNARAARIPFYAISRSKFQNLFVNLGANGKVKDWSSSKQGMY